MAYGLKPSSCDPLSPNKFNNLSCKCLLTRPSKLEIDCESIGYLFEYVTKKLTSETGEAEPRVFCLTV